MKIRQVYILFIFSILLTSTLFAQKLDMELFDGLKPRSIGPAGMSGRVTAIDVVLKNTEIIYVGTASGGLWRSTSGGIAWEPIFDDQPAASIGAVAVDQNIPDIIWIGTGEGNPRNSQNSGNGIYKSIDGGRTWKFIGLDKTFNIHRIIIDPTNSSVVYVAAQGSAWGEGSERGIFKSTDAGKSWKKILFVDEKTGAADLIMDPSNPNKLFAAMWQYRRWPWFFKSGGPSSGLYITFDGGETWQRRTDEDGLPKGELGRIGLAIAKNNPKVVYALIEAKKNALYRSDDGGFKWRMTADENIGNRPFYYNELYVDPENENRIYNLYSIVTMSEDGGRTFQTLIPGNEVHPDHHAWWINPKNGNHIIDGNDGGLAISHDRGKTWRFIGNLPLGQFYHINVDMETPYNVYGGLQDNGSWKGPSRVNAAGGIRNSYWEEVGFGDGFDVAADFADSRYIYYMSQGGNLGRYDHITGDRKLILPVHPNGEKLRFNWNAGFAQDPFNKTTIYYGSQYLHKSTDRGNNWAIISPDLTTNDTTKQKQIDSGGLTYDVTNAENFTTILAIAPSPLKEGIIWIGSDDGNVQLTKDGGKTWENLTKNIKGVPEGSWIPQIRASSYKTEEAFVVINNYRRDDWKPYVLHTNDFGKTWMPVVKENDVSGYALSFIQDPVEKNLYFLGTEFGLYFSLDAGRTWTKWTAGYPTVSTYDLAIHPLEHDLVIGTFGRSVYIFDDIRPLRRMAKEGINLLDKKLISFEISDAYRYSQKQAPGTRFAAAAEFKGENLQQGAMITYYLAPDTSQISEKVKIEIFDENNNLLRNLFNNYGKGFNRIFWEFERKGVRFPGMPKPKDNEELSGSPVLPGNYKVKITFGKNSDSTYLNVHYDPRLDINLTDLKERDRILTELSRKIEIITLASDKLDDAVKTINLIEDKLKGSRNAEVVKVITSVRSLKDTIKNLNELINQPRMQGIRTDDQKLGVKLRRAYSSVTGYWDKPGESERVNLKVVDDSIFEIINKINLFFEQNWKGFIKSVEELKIGLFEEYVPLKL
ncbi:MAG: hypothetical protein RDU14_03140 [Melioribacteraceae bacterium]|nr:hypothetical protein [Melioribacteraceae bacterium]